MSDQSTGVSPFPSRDVSGCVRVFHQEFTNSDQSTYSSTANDRRGRIRVVDRALADADQATYRCAEPDGYLTCRKAVRDQPVVLPGQGPDFEVGNRVSDADVRVY